MTVARNRKQRRIAASQLRGSITDTTITVSPKIPKDLNIPQGYKLKGQGGMTVETIKPLLCKKKILVESKTAF